MSELLPFERGAEEAGMDAQAYSAAFEAISAQVAAQQEQVQAESTAAAEMLQELLAMPPARRLLMVRNCQRFHSLSLCQRLERESRREAFHAPDASLELAQLATAIADRLDRDLYGVAVVNDVRARSWGQVGNAHRVAGDYSAAEAAFNLGTTALEQGSGDPLELAWFFDLLATLRRFQNRLQEGRKLQQAAIGLYQELCDGHMEGRGLIKLAYFQRLDGELEATRQSLRQGLALIDVEREPLLVVSASHMLAFTLIDEGRYQEARLALQRARQGLSYLEDHQLSYLRIKWMEGRIDRGLGRLKRAELAFRLVRQGFIRLGLAFEVARVSMDLAQLYAEQQRTGHIRQLVAEMLPLFESRELNQDAMAALLLFRQAVETERVSAPLVEKLRTRLDESQQDSSLRYRGSQTVSH